MKCKRCGACCRVFGLYELTAVDKARVPRWLWRKCHLYPDGAMMKTVGFRCFALVGDNCCKIRKDRPDVCRRFTPGSELCKMARRQDKKPE